MQFPAGSHNGLRNHRDPAPMFAFNSSGLLLVRIARILATSLAPSQYGTWLSLSETFTSIAGYACALTLS